MSRRASASEPLLLDAEDGSGSQPHVDPDARPVLEIRGRLRALRLFVDTLRRRSAFDTRCLYCEREVEIDLCAGFLAEIVRECRTKVQGVDVPESERDGFVSELDDLEIRTASDRAERCQLGLELRLATESGRRRGADQPDALEIVRVVGAGTCGNAAHLSITLELSRTPLNEIPHLLRGPSRQVFETHRKVAEELLEELHRALTPEWQT